MTPPNFGSGGGSWVPGMAVVAPGEPGVPVVPWARAAMVAHTTRLEAVAIVESCFKSKHSSSWSPKAAFGVTSPPIGL